MYSPLIQIPGWQELVPGAVYRQENKKPIYIDNVQSEQLILMQRYTSTTKSQILKIMQERSWCFLSGKKTPTYDEFTKRLEFVERDLVKRIISDDFLMHFVINHDEQSNNVINLETGFLPSKLMAYYERGAGNMHWSWYTHMLNAFREEQEGFGFDHLLTLFYNRDGLLPRQEFEDEVKRISEKDRQEYDPTKGMRLIYEDFFNLAYTHLSDLNTIQKIFDISPLWLEKQMVLSLENYIKKITLPEGAVPVLRNNPRSISATTSTNGDVTYERMSPGMPWDESDRKKFH